MKIMEFFVIKKDYDKGFYGICVWIISYLLFYTLKIDLIIEDNYIIGKSNSSNKKTNSIYMSNSLTEKSDSIEE